VAHALVFVRGSVTCCRSCSDAASKSNSLQVHRLGSDVAPSTILAKVHASHVDIAVGGLSKP
jgi:hypothetical protein